MHADEISFLFGEPLYSDMMNFTYSEKIFSRKLLKYWSNFVRYDDPNGPKKLPNNHTQVNLNNGILIHKISNDIRRNTLTMRQKIEHWPKYEVKFDNERDEQRAFLILNANKIEVDYNFRAEYCSFWGSYLPSLVLAEGKLLTFKLISLKG